MRRALRAAIFAAFSFLSAPALSYNESSIPLDRVATNAALLTVNPLYVKAVRRDGYATAGDGGAANYFYSSSACTLNSGTGDGGSQIPASGGGCWNVEAQSLVDIRVWPVYPNLSYRDSGPGLRSAAAYSAANGVAISFPAGNNFYCNSVDTTQGNLGCIVAGAPVATTVTVGASPGATTLTLASVSGIVNGSVIGVQTTTGKIFHGQVSGAPSGNVITLSSALVGTVSAGANFWLYNGTNPPATFSFRSNNPVGNADRCGVSTPQIVLGANVNRPLVFIHSQSVAPSIVNMCLNGNNAAQAGWPGTASGWSGGAVGGLFVVQVDDSGSVVPERSLVSDHSAYLSGYNGGVYIGAYSGTFWSNNDWYEYSGNGLADTQLYLNGYDTTLINPSVGGNALSGYGGIGIAIAEGAQYQIFGGAVFLNRGPGMTVNGKAVTSLFVSGTMFQQNYQGCVDELQAPAAGTNVGAHVYDSVVFDSCSQASAGTYPDVYVGSTNNTVSLVHPTFLGHLNLSDKLPNYNVQSLDSFVNITNPSWGSLGSSGASATGAFSNCALMRGLMNFSCSWTPTVITSGTAGTPAYTVHSGSYSVQGQNVTARGTIILSGWTGSPTGNVSISGLPLFSTATANDYGNCKFFKFGGWTGGAGFTSLSAIIATSSATAALYDIGSGKTDTPTPISELTAASVSWVFECSYHIDN